MDFPMTPLTKPAIAILATLATVTVFVAAVAFITPHRAAPVAEAVPDGARLWSEEMAKLNAPAIPAILAAPSHVAHDPAPAAAAPEPNADLIASLLPPRGPGQYDPYEYFPRAMAIEQLNSDVAYYGARTVILCWYPMDAKTADRDCLKRADLLNRYR